MAEKKGIITTMIFFYEANCPGFQAWIKQLQTFGKQLLHVHSCSAQPARAGTGAPPGHVAAAQARSPKLDPAFWGVSRYHLVISGYTMPIPIHGLCLFEHCVIQVHRLEEWEVLAL